jgi:hypothetical protein
MSSIAGDCGRADTLGTCLREEDGPTERKEDSWKGEVSFAMLRVMCLKRDGDSKKDLEFIWVVSAC